MPWAGVALRQRVAPGVAAEPGDEGLERRAQHAGPGDDVVAETGQGVLEEDDQPAGGELALDEHAGR